MRRINHKIIDNVELKRCNLCRKWLPVSCFSKAMRRWDNLTLSCKCCQKKEYDANVDKMRNRKRRYYKDNPEKMRERTKIWNKANPGKAKIRAIVWRKANPGKIKAWLSANQEKVLASSKRAMKKKLSTPKGRLIDNVRRSVNHCLKFGKNGKHTFDLLGYSVDDLIKRLIKTLPEGHTWNDYITGSLHLDHIIPISAHNFIKAEDVDFKRCWALKNLQLLPASENISKSARLDRPFQPSLIFN